MNPHIPRFHASIISESEVSITVLCLYFQLATQQYETRTVRKVRL